MPDRQKHVDETWNNTDVARAALRGPGSSPGRRRDSTSCLFSGLVVIASTKLPIPSRTRPISVPTPMVLRLKTWESRSPPDLTRDNLTRKTISYRFPPTARNNPGAGWSSPVARQAHNLKVTGSNPVPATTSTCAPASPYTPPFGAVFAFAAIPPQPCKDEHGVGLDGPDRRFRHRAEVPHHAVNNECRA